jgi:glycosyltransferase involved in cell wall biosynthesis
MDKMRIAMVAPSEIPARRANSMQVMKMAQAIAALDHDVRLAAPASKAPLNEQSPGWDALAHHYGLQTRFQVEWLPARPRLRRYDFGFSAVNWAGGWGADLLYTRLPQAAALASLRGTATILEVHDMPQGNAGPLLFRAFLKGRGARRLVVITQSLLNDLHEKLAAPVDEAFTLVAADGVDLSRYANLPEIHEARRRLPERISRLLGVERMVAGYTGHLYQGRGVELMLEVAARLPEISFLLVGGEPEDVNNLEKRVLQKNLSNVILPGFVPNAELPVYQAACDFLLMPYQQRVAASSGGDIAAYLSPMKLFEYMACGRPILSSDLPVLQEVLQPEFAVLLPPDNPNAWEVALRELAGNPGQRAELGSRARARALHYSWEARASRVLEGIKL